MGEGNENKDLETLHRATAAVVKAIGHRAELEVAFVREGSVGAAGERVKIIAPEKIATGNDLARLRGAADAQAVRLRFHNPSLHFVSRPSEPKAAFLFDVLESARCEALGARRMAGLGHNIGAFLEKEAARAAADKDNLFLPALVHLVAHEKIGGHALSVAARQKTAAWEKYFEGRAFWEPLLSKIEDQKEFALSSLRFLAELDLLPKKEAPEEQKDAPPSKDEREEEEEPSPQPDKEPSSQSAAGEGEEAQEEGESAASPQGVSGEDASSQEEQATRAATSADMREGPVTTYRIFTKAYDEMISASELCSARELARLRLMLDRQLRPLQKTILRLANKLQRLLMTQQTRTWLFDQEEGLLDAARLARVVANPVLPLSFKVEKDADFRDTVVTLLIDNSGSMRGRPITLAAISADILARTLERCGVKTEILGFTTRTWKGGRAREEWVKHEKPARPGRLNETRHVIYKEAAQPWRRTKNNLGLMLREGLLKENIDGEALLWAHKRMMKRPEARRILMVISDGAPVDDSTLSANPSNYLDAHLREVIHWIERHGAVELCAIGIGHDVTRYYSRAVCITSPDDLAGTMTEQLASLFEAP
jgi:cobaltochelatase CobT